MRCPFAEWIPSPNWSGGWNEPVRTRVQHTTVGSMASAIATFKSSTRQVSAHFIVGLDGRIVQMVDTANRAWHARAANEFSIGIEHVDDGDYWGPRTPELYAASARLNRWLGEQLGLAPTPATIERHKIYVNTACPDGLDVDRIIRETGGTSEVPTQAEWETHLAEEANTAAAIKSLLNPIATWVFDAPNRPLNAKDKAAFKKALAALDRASTPPKRAKRPTAAQVRAGHGATAAQRAAARR